MTRSEVLTQYRPIRAGIQRVLRLAANACKRADLTRAVKQVAPWAEELSDEEAADMIVDVALFEPNQRGRRAFERFLAEKGEQLEPVDRALAQSMTRPFSLCSVWPNGMRRPGFGWKICWMRTAGSGWWTRDWRHLRLRGTSLACAYSMPGRFTPASESSWPRTKTRLRSALRRRHAAGPCRCDTRLRPRCMATASGLTPQPDRQIWLCSKLYWSSLAPHPPHLRKLHHQRSAADHRTLAAARILVRGNWDRL